MRVDLRYLKPSGVSASGDSAMVRLSSNLARPPVSFDGGLRDPLAYREAMSALHEVVTLDPGFDREARDRKAAAYEAWKEARTEEEDALRRFAHRSALHQHERALKDGPPPGLKDDFRRKSRAYWTARQRFLKQLRSGDPRLFRKLVPLDPVVTVAPDAVIFECFSKDGSAYGCLLVDRAAFDEAGGVRCGTTNVDYSQALYDHLQKLRTYRGTRLQIDPGGVEIAVDDRGLREEKIDLPPSWLRGFGQLQAAMTLPSERIELPVTALYSTLAVLARRRERAGPRCLRFELEPGAPPRLLLDPWGLEISCRGAPAYQGPAPRTVKLWGRRRLMALARLLPLAESVEARLLGDGLPHVWVVRMGALRFVLGLSGWTRNRWTAGASLDLLAGGYPTSPAAIDAAARALSDAHSLTLEALLAAAGLERRAALGALFQLARRGQVLYDYAGERYRWRQAMPLALTGELLGEDPPELVAALRFIERGEVLLTRREPLSPDQLLLMGGAGGVACETIISSEGRFSRARCSCSFFYRSRLRMGPCRHLLALKLAANRLPDLPTPPGTPLTW